MTGGEEHRSMSPWLPPNNNNNNKKSYNIADILNNDRGNCCAGRDNRDANSPPIIIIDQQEGDQPPPSPRAQISPFPVILQPTLIPLVGNSGASEESASNPSTPQLAPALGDGPGGRQRAPVIPPDMVHNHHYRVGGHPEVVLRRASPPSHRSPFEIPNMLPGQGYHHQFLTGGLGPHHPQAGLFPSPNYISLLLANPFVQPYLQHHQQRFQDFYGYNGRQFGMGSKRKGGQVRFAAAQTARLEKEFLDHKYLHANDRKRLAQALKLTDRQVKTWFQNRRAKWRKVGVMKGHRSESHHISACPFGGTQDDREGYSPDQGRCCISVSTIVSDESD